MKVYIAYLGGEQIGVFRVSQNALTFLENYQIEPAKNDTEAWERRVEMRIVDVVTDFAL